MQVVELPTLKLPAAQGTGAAVVVGHSEPGGHSMQAAADGPARLYVPAAHGRGGRPVDGQA